MIPNSCIPVSYVRMMGHTLSYEVSIAATWRFSKHIAVGPGTLSEKPDKCSRKQKSTRTCIPLSKGYVAYTTSLVMELTEMTSVERASSASTCPEFNTSNWGHCIRHLYHPDHVSCCQSRRDINFARLSPCYNHGPSRDSDYQYQLWPLDKHLTIIKSRSSTITCPL